MSEIFRRKAELEQIKADRARLLEIFREFSVALDLRKEELDEMIKRAKDDDDLPEDFYLGLLPPEAANETKANASCTATKTH